MKPLASHVARGGFPRCGDVGLQAQRPRLMAALATLARLLEGLVGPRGRFVRAPGEEQRLTQRGEPPCVPADVPQPFGLIDRRAQDGHAFGYSAGEGIGMAEGRREPWTVDRELPAPTHVETADEGGRGLAEPPPIEVRAADGGEGAGEREWTIDPRGEFQRTLGRGERLVEPPQFRQRRGDVVEAELGQAELRWPPRWTVTRGRALGLLRCPTALEEAHRLPVLAQTPVDLTEPEVRLHREPAAREGLRQGEGTWPDASA